LHAEQNVILSALQQGSSLVGCTLYCTAKPCCTCIKLIIGAKFKKIVYEGEYPDEFTDAIIDDNPYMSAPRLNEHGLWQINTDFDKKLIPQFKVTTLF
jgi:deoxycytidylate deaminase